jgi:hypothetical protein
MPEAPPPVPPTLPASDPPFEPEPLPAVAAEVINLKTAKANGAAEHKAYVDNVTDLCTLAAAPERVGAYVRAGTPVEQVRKELLAMRAAEPPIVSQHPLADRTAAQATMWGKITDKLNARIRK